MSPEKMAARARRTRDVADPILSFLAFVEADHELAGKKLTDDAIVCSLNVAGGSTQLTIGNLRALREALYGETPP